MLDSPARNLAGRLFARQQSAVLAHGIDWRLGTMGFSYGDWSGVFYPPGVDGAERLRHYAKFFDAVELDTTFHATPAPRTVERWAEVTPEEFRFTAKLPKLITHRSMAGQLMTDEIARVATAEFLEGIQPLGPKLLAVLIQLPPSFDASHFDELAAYLSTLPEEPRFAIELRHSSWWSPRTVNLLRDRGVSWVLADEPPRDIAHLPPDSKELSPTDYRPRQPLLTTDWFYLRFIGRHDQFEDKAAERLDPTRRLRWWADRLETLAAGGRVREIVGFFSNGYSGHSPATCRRVQSMLGLPTPPLQTGSPLFE